MCTYSLIWMPWLLPWSNALTTLPHIDAHTHTQIHINIHILPWSNVQTTLPHIDIYTHVHSLNWLHPLFGTPEQCTTYRYRGLRLVGSLKLHVSFAEYRPFYRSLLQKRPTILRSLLIVATQYVYSYHTHRHLHTRTLPCWYTLHCVPSQSVY